MLYPNAFVTVKGEMDANVNLFQEGKRLLCILVLSHPFKKPFEKISICPNGLPIHSKKISIRSNGSAIH